MRCILISFATAGLLAFGCTKKGGAEPVAEVSAEPAPTSGSGSESQLVTANLEELNRMVAQQQYDAAVGSLVAMSQLPKSPAQQAQYTAKLRQTETALLQKAQAGDAAAQQSAQMLGRMMTGR